MYLQYISGQKLLPAPPKQWILFCGVEARRKLKMWLINASKVNEKEANGFFSDEPIVFAEVLNRQRL